nr:hypothetical protein [Pandoravirus massiliensis]
MCVAFPLFGRGFPSQKAPSVWWKRQKSNQEGHSRPAALYKGGKRESHRKGTADARQNHFIHISLSFCCSFFDWLQNASNEKKAPTIKTRGHGPNKDPSTPSHCALRKTHTSARFFALVPFLTNKNNNLNTINMATTMCNTCIAPSTDAEPCQDFCLTKEELESMISGESTVAEQKAGATDALDGNRADVASVSAAVAHVPDVPPLPQAAETLTIAGLYKMIKDLNDPDAQVEAASVVETVAIRFHLDAESNCVQDSAHLTRQVDTTHLVADDLAGCAAISFVGRKPLTARALLDALDGCIERYGDVRVCVRQNRAVARLRKTVTLCTDTLLFKDDPVSLTDAERVRGMARVGETLIQSGVVNMEYVADKLSRLMPRHWQQTYYLLDGVLIPNIKGVYKRLPTIDKSALGALFVAIGTPPPSGKDNADHGTVIIHALVPGVTYAMLESAYGSSATKVSRLLSMADAAQSAAPVDPLAL